MSWLPSWWHYIGREPPFTQGATILRRHHCQKLLTVTVQEKTFKRDTTRFIWCGDLDCSIRLPMLYARHYIPDMQQLAHAYFCQLFLARSGWLMLFLSVIYVMQQLAANAVTVPGYGWLPTCSYCSIQVGHQQ